MPEPAMGTELLATEPCLAAAAAGGPTKGFDLSNASGLESEVLTPDVATSGVLLATAVSLLSSGSFGDEISKKMAPASVAGTGAGPVVEEELEDTNLGAECVFSVLGALSERCAA